jgi:hypothetical protein
MTGYTKGIVNEGDNIELWFSTEINFNGKREPSGTVFIHGLYFAHESEFIDNQLRGSPSKETFGKPLNNNPERKWSRQPND